MIPGYYANQQNELVVVMPDKTTYAWVESEDAWAVFKLTKIMESVFDWDYLGEL